MKRLYNKPVLEIEKFITEEIMETFNPVNVLSYNPATGEGGYGTGLDNDGFIRFNSEGDNSANVLNGIDYNDFTN